MKSSDAKKFIEYIRKTDYKLNDWELGFIASVERLRYGLTKKQSQSLLNIYGKATGGGLYQKRERIG